MNQHVETLVSARQLRLQKSRQLVADLFFMGKPTVGLLVVVTAIPALLIAAEGQFPAFALAASTLFGILLVSIASAVFNQLIDREIDQLMPRTKQRPLPSLRLSVSFAWLYGIACLLLGLALLYFFATPLAAYVALGGFAFYLVVYSLLLKKRTAQNIVIGGAAGAVGPLIGYAAVANSLDYPAWLLFALIFFWTPPHFWALALKYKDDYAMANIPMLPVVSGDEKTRLHIFLYTLSLFPIVIGLYYLGTASILALSINLILTAVFAHRAFQLYASHRNKTCMEVFHFSCLYLFAIFGVITLDQMIFIF